MILGKREAAPDTQELAWCYQPGLAAVTIYSSSFVVTEVSVRLASCQLITRKLFPEMPQTNKSPRPCQRAVCVLGCTFDTHALSLQLCLSMYFLLAQNLKVSQRSELKPLSRLSWA